MAVIDSTVRKRQADDSLDEKRKTEKRKGEAGRDGSAAGTAEEECSHDGYKYADKKACRP
jgi:hypothetical protein